MANKPISSTTSDRVLYPHLKITREKFPRLLATRRILNEKDQYFGAFLPATNLRLWIYQLNKIFRLRSCEIKIDGDFAEPCQMFFAKKCLAPCVQKICGKAEYLENVQALSLFLGGDENDFREFAESKINENAELLEFEKAARWRDLLTDASTLKINKKLQISLETAVDIYDYEETDAQTIIHLFTTRGRKFAGNLEFVFERGENLTPPEMFEKIVKEFYVFHAPKEIRLPIYYPKRQELEKYFKEKFNRKVKISFHQNDLNPTAEFRLKRTKLEFSLDKIGGKLSADEIKNALVKNFKLVKKPNLIECFDVGHLAGENFVTASSVWVNGQMRPEKSVHFILDADNEPQAMAQGIAERLKIKPAPDLIIIDGGKSQFSAVLNEIGVGRKRDFSIISAVKPSGRHSAIAYLMLESGAKIDFREGDQIFELIRELRDEAHRNANELHRQLRENRAIHSKNLPLVPIRFDEIGGAAEDLIPIKSNLQKETQAQKS